MRRRSQVLQRELPRPVEVNNAILRPANTSDSSLTDLQRAEELIKKEMLTMMHYDSIRNPVGSAADNRHIIKQYLNLHFPGYQFRAQALHK